MRVALMVVLALVLAPAATSGGQLPPDHEDCAPGEARLVVERFVRAFNARNLTALKRVFAPQDTFNWFSSGAPGDRSGDQAYVRSTLIAYFKARHRQGERLRLVWLSHGGNSNGYAHFGFHVERRARGLPPRVYEGKGAVICAASGDTISVWSYGRPIRR
jgi:hypothetical protein